MAQIYPGKGRNNNGGSFKIVMLLFYINAERILELEELLLNWDKETEVAVSKDKGKYGYDGMSNDKSGDSYHHFFSTKYFKTRKEALLDLLIQYVHVEYIYKGVREIFIKCST